ncbi:MAG: XRE family transcriptional regulator [Lachnospiraceae bacterium]|nr:XRE family transcriptional regulator [Lachnospiraceae bacterium]
MTVPQKIKMALAYKGMSESELARALGKSPQAFNQRMKTGKFSTEDMERIAAAMEAEYFFGFQFKDGTKI